MSNRKLEGLSERGTFDVVKFDELGGFEIADERLLELISGGLSQERMIDVDADVYCPTSNTCTINMVKNCGGTTSPTTEV